MRHTIATWFVSFILAAAIPTTASVAATVNNLPVGTSSQNVAASVSSAGNVWSGIAQSITAVDQNVSFGFYLFGNSVASPIVYSLFEGDGVSGNMLKNVNVTSPSTGFSSTITPTMADFSSINLIIGQKYTFLATMPEFAYPPLGTYSDASAKYGASDSYAGGRFYFTGSFYNQNLPAFSTRDLAFSMIGVSPVPEPATWMMMMSGLAIAAMAIRRRRHVKLATSPTA